MRRFPLGQSRRALLLKLLPGGLLDMLGGINTKTVDTIIANPLAQPMSEVITRCGTGNFARGSWKVGRLTDDDVQTAKVTQEAIVEEGIR